MGNVTVAYATRKDAIADGWAPARPATALMGLTVLVVVERRWQPGRVVDATDATVTVDVNSQLVTSVRRDVLRLLAECGRCRMLLDPDIDTDAVIVNETAFCELCAFLEQLR